MKFLNLLPRAVVPRSRMMSTVRSAQFFVPKNIKGVSAVLYSREQGKKTTEVVCLEKSGRIKAVEIFDENAESETDISTHLASTVYRSSVADYQYEKILGALNPKVWHQFLDNLNPVVVFNLGLRTSPKKLPLYNFCIPRVENAADLSSEQNQRSIRNLSKAAGLFPLIVEIINIDREFGSKLLKKIEGEGGSREIIQDIKDHLKIPRATDGFLKRVSHANHPHYIRVLDGFLREGLTDSEGRFNDKLYNYRVASLPTHREEEQYSAMWKIIANLYMSNIGSVQMPKLSEKTKASIFLNSRSNFVANSQGIEVCIRDTLPQYSAAIADDLLLPVYVEEFHRQFFDKFQTSTKLLGKFEDGFTDHVRANLASFVNDKMISTLTPQKIVECFETLDRKTGQINQSKPISSERRSAESKPQWHKLFPDIQRDGYKFRVLDRESDLRDMGEKMNNCLGTFVKRCHAGVCHIVSIEAPDGEIFAMRINEHRKGINGLEIGEINSARNSFNVIDVTPVAQSVFQNIKNGKIPIIAQSGSIEKDFTISEFLGFDITQKEAVQSVFEAYRDTHVIPRTLIGREMSAEQFYDSIKLREFIADRVKADLALVEKPSAEVIPKYTRQAVSPLSKADQRMVYD